MQIEYHRWFSQNLNQDMELKVYGHFGTPILVFPCAGGKFIEFEEFGMINSIKHFIDEGRVKLFTIDSVDNQTWLSTHQHPFDRARRHNDYDEYVVQEVVPFIYTHTQSPQPIMTTGCSLGGMHALNFHLRHPDIFRMSISLSGVYTVKYFVGDCFDENVYLNSPIEFLPNLNDEWFLGKLRTSKIVLCCGRGAWDLESVNDSPIVADLLRSKGVPVWLEIWGHDVAHDWPWWRIQLPYFLERTL